MFEIFGDSIPTWAKFFIAFAVVLALIGLTAALVRRFGANRLSGGNARGRQPRLAVIDAAPVDGRRRLVLIRRDNVEHLLMIGGPTDVVVEQSIVRGAASSTRDAARTEPTVTAPVREPSTREFSSRESSARQPAAVPADNAWPLQPAVEPAPVVPTRPSRATEEPWMPPEPGARARPSDSNSHAGNSLANMAAELSSKLTPPPEVTPPAPVRNEPAPVVRASPPPVAPPVAAPEPVAVAPQNDHNLAEMAQQLEAALRRAPMPESRPPVTDALAQTPKAAPRDYKLRIDPKFEARPDTKFETKAEPRFESKVEPKFDVAAEPRPSAGAKSAFDNLEEEMASLLGRPPGKT